MNVVVRTTLAPPADERAVWDSLVPELSNEVPHPEHVQLAITDQFDQVVGEYAVQSPDRANPAETESDYSALKPDGAMAAARTIDLPDGKVAVIVPVTLTKLGSETVRRMLLHEAQHVRLYQVGDSAWAVHRRVTFQLPADLTWELIWLAESVIDEFRCERTTHELAGSHANMASDVAGYPGIVAAFEPVRLNYRRTHDLMAAYSGWFEVLQRLGVFLAYGAAHIAFDPTTAPVWATVPSMADLCNVVSQIPGAARRIGDEELTALSVEAARMLCRTSQEMGFDCYFRPDGLYFTLLR